MRQLPTRIARRVAKQLPSGARSLVVGRLGSKDAHDAAYWNAFYAPEPDPFRFDSNPDETTKFERTLSVCGSGRLGRVLELGCSVGTFTHLLAPRSDEVLAVDISPTAVGRATERLAHHDNVTCEVRELPDDLPGGPFDVIVASDVLYYWPLRDLLAAIPRMEAALAAGGALVAVHYLPSMGEVLTGDEVHDALARASTLEHTLSECTEFGVGRPYRVDRYEKARTA